MSKFKPRSFSTGFLLICAAALSLALSAISNNTRAQVPTDSTRKTTQAPSALCSALRPASGNIIRIDTSQTQQLPSLLATAKQGDTILLEDGYYDLNGANLWIATPGISLRSASGNPEGVILDGSYRSTQIITVAASDVRIAEITLKRAYTHPIHIVSSDAGDTKNTLVYRVNIIDPREQAIKINPHAPGRYVDSGTVACSRIQLTDEGREKVNSAAGGCYTGGIDAHQARDWIVRDNKITGFWCPSGLSEYAIHFWKGSRDTLVERNILSNNARGIGLGLLNDGAARTYNDSHCPAEKGTYIGHYGGIVKNNFVHASSAGLFASSAGFDCGICLWSACNSMVLHNTIVSTRKNFSSIEWRFKGSQGISIYNNIATHALRQRDGASAREENNLTRAGRYLFVDAQNGDLHLTSRSKSAVDKGKRLPQGLVDYDIDGEKRDSKPDIGADEFH